MKKIVLLTFALAAIWGCDKTDTYQTVTIEDRFSVELPDNLSAVPDLNPAASLQYQNPFDEFYVVVIEEPKASLADTAIDLSEGIDGYTEIIRNNLTESVAEAVISENEKRSVNGLNARLFTVTGKLDGLLIFYQFAIFEGRSQFYQLVQWTEAKRKDGFAERIEKTVGSFKETQTKMKKLKKAAR